MNNRDGEPSVQLELADKRKSQMTPSWQHRLGVQVPGLAQAIQAQQQLWQPIFYVTLSTCLMHREGYTSGHLKAGPLPRQYHRCSSVLDSDSDDDDKHEILALWHL